METWRPVVGFEDDYEVSDLGRVRSLTDRYGPRPAPRPMKVSIVNGYPRVVLERRGRRLQPALHRVVLAAFVGPAPDGFHGAHLDGNPLNPKLENLRWCSASENNRHKIVHGTIVRGERIPGAKLTREKVVAIRAAMRADWRPEDLSARYNVSQQTIICAATGRYWAHVPGAVAPPASVVRRGQCPVRVRDQLVRALTALLTETVPITGDPPEEVILAHWKRERELGNAYAPIVLAGYAALAAAKSYKS